MSGSEDDGGRQPSTVTLRKVKSLLSEERKNLTTDISKSLLENLTTTLSRSLHDSLMAGFEQIIDKKLAVLNVKINSVEAAVASTTNIITKLVSDMNDLKAANDILSVEVANLQNENENLKHSSTTNPDKFRELEERVEERTNRSLRQTMVFKGIPEVPREKWSDTTKILAQKIAECCDVPYVDAENSINRAHRSGSNMNKPRHIYANFYEWGVTQDIVKKFRSQNFESPDFKIYAEYKYGPLTSVRRSEALKMRKSLKEGNIIISGYVKYPARLMVKYSSDDKGYTEHEDFSKMPVDLKNFRSRNNQTG